MSLPLTLTCPEKRRHVRYECEVNIKWSYFNQQAYFDAKLVNFSENGLYFETGRELKPGVSIFLDMKRISSTMDKSKVHRPLRSVSLGEVQWCIDLSRSHKICYGVGVRFPFPY